MEKIETDMLDNIEKLENLAIEQLQMAHKLKYGDKGGEILANVVVALISSKVAIQNNDRTMAEMWINEAIERVAKILCIKV